MDTFRPRQPVRRPLATTGLALALQLMSGSRSRGENHGDYKFESYNEENGRIQIETHSVLIYQTVNSRLALSGQFVYDSISGATPTGAPPPVGSKQVPTAQMDDIRRAETLTANLRLANHTLSPQVAYSKESDHESIGVAITDAIDYNEKNTTLVLGVWHDFDSIQPTFWTTSKHTDQRAANSYGEGFSGDPSDPASTAPIPKDCSADSRLLALQAFAHGLQATATISDRFWLEAAYKRQEMIGTDHSTPARAYPKANGLTAGGCLWW